MEAFNQYKLDLENYDKHLQEQHTYNDNLQKHLDEKDEDLKNQELKYVVDENKYQKEFNAFKTPETNFEKEKADFLQKYKAKKEEFEKEKENVAADLKLEKKLKKEQEDKQAKLNNKEEELGVQEKNLKLWRLNLDQEQEILKQEKAIVEKLIGQNLELCSARDKELNDKKILNKQLVELRNIEKRYEQYLKAEIDASKELEAKVTAELKEEQ